MAAVIPFGGGTLLAVSAVLATSTSAMAAACWDRGCYGIDPQTSGCSANAYTVYPATPLKDSGGTTLGTVELRYSNSCGANWARTTGYSQYNPHAIWADIYNNIGQHQPGDYNQGNPPLLLWSYMIGGAGESDYACGQLADEGSGAGPTCTASA
jgi:Protein of unknown function (DUF2690)